METFIRDFKANLSRLSKQSSTLKLLKTLSAIEYAEAILEITAGKLFGERLKWFLILLLQLTKCVIRLRLLILHRIGIHPLPSLFNANMFLKSQQVSLGGTGNQEVAKKKSVYRLRSSGRYVRTIDNAPTNVVDRDWSVPVETIDFNNNDDEHKKNRTTNDDDKEDEDDEESGELKKSSRGLDAQRYFAEMLHILRPSVHLFSLFFFDATSWKQFLLPFVMDLASLLLMHGTQNLNDNQKKELKRRTIIFLYYFMRSPVHEKFSSSLINLSLSQLEQRIPGMRYLANPIRNYIPYWRSVYSYCWSY